ncbi:hypothetical protein EV361DRAFT_890076 [Lentinula raphanica]|uniref:Uncharacterized protein n=1 Tax=Lentinula raphanica TaxID=153919 RepID=A0AA38PF02_9AGAR|nr:hypothetical protein F5878DRAFT_451221 [Lentinula raphanica]KAJ3975196.1 hypothetical protein EV361DRAFT_890076 [Lentinula raphanica]
MFHNKVLHHFHRFDIKILLLITLAALASVTCAVPITPSPNDQSSIRSVLTTIEPRAFEDALQKVHDFTSTVCTSLWRQIVSPDSYESLRHQDSKRYREFLDDARERNAVLSEQSIAGEALANIDGPLRYKFCPANDEHRLDVSNQIEDATCIVGTVERVLSSYASERGVVHLEPREVAGTIPASFFFHVHINSKLQFYDSDGKRRSVGPCNLYIQTWPWLEWVALFSHDGTMIHHDIVDNRPGRRA